MSAVPDEVLDQIRRNAATQSLGDENALLLSALRNIVSAIEENNYHAAKAFVITQARAAIRQAEHNRRIRRGR